jgi:hypothetical protein
MPAKPNAFSFRVSLRASNGSVQVAQGAFDCSIPHLHRVLNALPLAWTFELGDYDPKLPGYRLRL